ncbi:DUF916 domain-containing protein [Agromyces badenianii]|uniref:DUF916 domain-containing protein n=1 Tax=Agromyces badenianii TaxID=2080742 RepID=UPI0014055DB3|nr:DUF916 domain-containing protein [Agromyces badenianii]
MQSFPTRARPISRLAALLALAFLAGTAAAIAPAAGSFAEGDDGTIGISGAPLADANTTGRTRFSYQVSPGQTVEDAYVVANTGTVAQTFAVFATDAFNSEDGGYGLLDTGVAPSDAGAWVVFDGGTTKLDILLQPGESKVVPFSVTVPADAAPGDHAAGIVISAVSPDGQVLVDRRVGTRLYVRVPGELQPNLTVSSMTASYEPTLNPFAGDTTVTFTVRNAGNVALGADMIVGVTGVFGVGLGAAVEEELSEMLPGSTRTVTVVVPGVGQWVYLNPYVSMAPKVDPEALNPGPLSVVHRDIVIFVVPWVLLALVVIGLGVWAWIRFSRSRNDRNAKAWIEHTEAEARRKADAERDLVGAGEGSRGVSES